MKKHHDNDYYVGLDIGTNSIGWAVTDTDYNIPKFKGNSMWGVRLFEECQTAVKRRAFRAGRRRLDRRKERVAILESLFDKEISKTDPAFFMRLRESNLCTEHKITGSHFTVFNDKNFTDKDYNKKYPTIYHLRKELIDADEKDTDAIHDIRLVYLAVHHIIKNRGHFLFPDFNVEQINDFSNVYEALISYIRENYEYEVSCSDTAKLADVLRDKKLNKTKKASAILSCIGITKKSEPRIAAMFTLLAGSSVKLFDIFEDEALKEAEKNSISFSADYDENETAYENELGERFELIELLKAVYDWAILANIVKDEDKGYLSYSKVRVYNEHKADLKMLKEYVKTYLPQTYKVIFRKCNKGSANYVAYSGHITYKGDIIDERAEQTDFCRFLRNTLGKCMDDNYSDMFTKIENGTFLEKPISKKNGVIPMQIQEKELKKILENASKYHAFLTEKDQNGTSAVNKILATFRFRIPYYVGPLNRNSDKSWLERTDEKIFPWNFEKVVDLHKSADKFIANLTSKCTYIPTADVIPKNSLLYSKYMVLNELNKLKVCGEPISVKEKQELFMELYLKHKKVTAKMIRQFFASKLCKSESEIILTGIDLEPKSSMRSYIDLAEYSLDEAAKEDIIRMITILGADSKMLKKRLKMNYPQLTDEEIKKISKLKYEGWGALSKELLTEVTGVIPDMGTGEVVNIITALWTTNHIFMEIINYDMFNESLASKRNGDEHKSLKTKVEEMCVSPKVKRPVHQSIQIVQEIIKCMGHKPKKIFIEVTREDGVKGDKGRTHSRKDQLLKLYEAARNDADKMIATDIYNELVNEDERKVSMRDKYYLYYTQLGKCMYTNKRISLSELSDTNLYDIDHIYPRSLIKDDSLDNRVLVCKTDNQKKDNEYPINPDIQTKQRGIWKMLNKKGLISDKKYDRLMRTTKLTDDELAQFINRQVVETGQATKAVATLLTGMYKETEIVWVKSKLISDFRKERGLLKCRDVNDLHHAKDAYLNVVVGNVYNTLFNHGMKRSIERMQCKALSLNKIFDYNVQDAWIADNEKSIDIVKNTMGKNNILYTRYAFKRSGGLFKQLPVKKGKGQVPLKMNSALSDIDRYGGYQLPTATYFSLVEYEKGKKLIRKLVAIDLYREKMFADNPQLYMTEKHGMKNPRIIIPCIRIDSCLSFDGTRVHLSGKDDGIKTINYKSAIQLVIGGEWEKYVRKLSQRVKEMSDKGNSHVDYIEDKIKDSTANTNADNAKKVIITTEKNIQLYDLLCDKLTNKVYRLLFGGIGTSLKNARDNFCSLDKNKQCYELMQILALTRCNATTADLKDIGIQADGRIRFSSTIQGGTGKSFDSVKLINQSVTGLFENETELLRKE